MSRALIFDFDGVLANTEPLYWRAWESLLSPHSLTLTWEDYCRFGRGVKDEDMLKSLPLLSAQPHIVELLREQMDSRKEMVRSWCMQRSPISQSTARLLHSLGKFRLGLVTSSDRSEVEPLLRKAGIDKCFEASVFRSDVERHKPDPAPYLRIAELLRVRTGTVFEDSEAGIRSATEAGFHAVRVADPEDLARVLKALLRD
jgi:beta-phosphoglucomutase